jgi:hypothetical protein
MDPEEARTAYLALLSSLAPQWQTWRGLAAASEQQAKTEPAPSQSASSDVRGVPDPEHNHAASSVSRSVQTFGASMIKMSFFYCVCMYI